MRNAQILVVVDEVIVAENIRGMLRSFGYGAPSPARSGEEAVQRAESAPPDMALIDIQLGG
jgi:CheY-like chemotaxis protein